MAKGIVLITGGARSGKSRYAEERASALGTRLVYLATAQAGDQEMARRIAEHQKRRGANWTTVEEPLEIGQVLTSQKGKVDSLVIDCLTLWISNLLTQGGEQETRKRAEDLIATFPEADFHLFLVTNEVGWGIVPDNPLARQFRDLAGWVNQRVASIADEAVLMVAGNPVVVKKVDKLGWLKG
jgi:adenosylcobinamide kinase/adenosylcobinamide-phosphate guanylyltransferase